MAFIPDPFSATVRIGVRWRGGRLFTLDEKPFPEIQDGTLFQIILPSWAVTNDKDRERLTSKHKIDMLPADSVVLLGVSRSVVPQEFQGKFVHLDC